MALELKQSLKLSQQLLITPQLQQAIKLLQLSRIELEDYLAQQIEENPILEVHDSSSPEPDELLPEASDYDADPTRSDRVLNDLGANAAESANIANETDARPGDEPDPSLADSVIVDASDFIYAAHHDSAINNLESYTQYNVSLVDHLMAQVRETDFSPAEVQVAIYIIGNLTGIGYLDLDIEGFCEEHQIDPELFAGVLDTVQRFDPPGIAARDLSECLLLQVRQKKIKNPLVEKLITTHLPALAQRSIVALSRELKIEPGELSGAISIIKSLEPRPARQFVSSPVQQVIPDVRVIKLSGQWQVIANGEGLPNLRINTMYAQMGKGRSGEKDKAYWQEKHKAAQWLIRSVQQRQKTIYKVAECIVARQRDFFELGAQGLRPMILKDVANEIGMHESTISRVTTHKYMGTPRGTFELKYFFNNAVQGMGGGEHCSEAVKELIKDLLHHEDTFNPYSDKKIGTILQERGIKLARRTVAKYRDQLGVLSSPKRKKYKEDL